jgi:GNAT superfamily N-acetyltransferase
LLSGGITIVQARPDSDVSLRLLTKLDADLHRYRYPPESRHAFSVEKLIREGVAFFVACYDGEPAACGGLKLFGDYGEVKRMYVRPAFRGKGLGKAILGQLTDHARANGISKLRLETGIYQVEAIGLYDASGFARRRPFGDYQNDPNTIYFEKQLA